MRLGLLVAALLAASASAAKAACRFTQNALTGYFTRRAIRRFPATGGGGEENPGCS